MATTITVDEETLDEFNDAKDEYRVGTTDRKLSSSEFLRELLANWEGEESDGENEFNSLASEEDIKRLEGRLDDLENTIPRKTAEELR